MTSTQFKNAGKRIEKLNDWFKNRYIDTAINFIENAEEEIKRIRYGAIKAQIDELQPYQKEFQDTINDEVYTSPFGPTGQEKIKISKKDQREAQTEYNRISKTITYLQDILLEMA